MATNVKPSSIITLVDRLSPVSQGAGAASTGWVDMSLYESIFGVIFTGVLGAAATVDAKFEQATSSGGAGVKDITGSAITQLVKASNDNNEVWMECQDEQMDSTGGFRYVRLTVTVGAAASILCAGLFTLGARFQPGTQKATVVQIKQVRA